MKATPQIRQRLSRFRIAKPLAGDPEMLDRFILALRPKEFSPGVEIVSKGESGTEAYLLVRGTVEIVDFNLQGEPYVKAVLDQDAQVLFGEMALVTSDVRTATVRSRTPCECWMLRRDDFLRLGEENPRLGWATLLEIARLLAERLKRTNEDVLRLFEALVMMLEDETGTR